MLVADGNSSLSEVICRNTALYLAERKVTHPICGVLVDGKKRPQYTLAENNRGVIDACFLSSTKPEPWSLNSW